MSNGLQIIQIISATVLVALVLIQTKGTAGFAKPSSYSPSFTRRGLEKIVYKATFVVAAFFVLVSLLPLFI